MVFDVQAKNSLAVQLVIGMDGVFGLFAVPAFSNIAFRHLRRRLLSLSRLLTSLDLMVCPQM